MFFMQNLTLLEGLQLQSRDWKQARRKSEVRISRRLSKSARKTEVAYSQAPDQIPLSSVSDSLALTGFSVLFVVEARLATAWHRTPRLLISATQSHPKGGPHSS